MKRNDLILIIILVILSFFSFFLFFPRKQLGNEVVIIKDGIHQENIPLNQNTSIEIEGKNGEKNKLVIQNGYADITEANCPDKLCVKQKRIKYSGEQLVCLPHKVIIKVIGNTKNDLDSIAN